MKEAKRQAKRKAKKKAARRHRNDVFVAWKKSRALSLMRAVQREIER